MIGFYNYTVLLTYVGLLCAMFGIFQAINGFYINALFCLGGTLLCDTLDGKVARMKSNRTTWESLFGMVYIEMGYIGRKQKGVLRAILSPEAVCRQGVDPLCKPGSIYHRYAD